MSVEFFLDAGMRGWITNTAKRNIWRVSDWYDVDELTADGYWCFAKCYNRYKKITGKRKPTEADRKHFMSLVKTTFSRHIINLANRKTRLGEMALSQFEETLELDTLLPPQAEVQTITVLLSQAPAEIAAVMEAFMSDISYARSRIVKVDGRIRLLRRALRETTNEQLCRLAGLDPNDIDMVSRVREYFTPERFGTKLEVEVKRRSE